MDKAILLILSEVKYELMTCEEALEKIKAINKKEMEKILEWGCAQGYKKPEGIEYKIEIEGEVYTIPEALEIYLNPSKGSAA